MIHRLGLQHGYSVYIWVMFGNQVAHQCKHLICKDIYTEENQIYV